MTQHVKGDGSLLAELGGGKSDSEAGMRIDEGEQVSAQSIAQAHHGIAGEHFNLTTLEWSGRFSGFAVAGDEFVATAGIQSSGSMAHFVGIAGDDAAEGRDAGQCEVLLPTPGS